MMLFSQFVRIETLAGGKACSNRAFIRAARTKLSGQGKSFKARAIRHEWLKSGLATLVVSKGL
jgi:hypothetical protein